MAAFLLLATSVFSQEQQHEFKKITAISAFHAGLRIADATQTCINSRNPNWRERGLPWQSCAPIAAYSAATIPAEMGVRYLLHRLGWHRLEPVNAGVWSAFVARAIEYSSTH